MADVTYQIIIKGEGNASESNANNTNAQKGSGVSTTLKGDDAGGFSLSKKQIKHMGMATASIAVNKALTTYINRVGVRTGNVTYQEKLSYTYSTAKRAIGIAGMIGGGIATQNPMLVFAGVTSAVSWGVDLAVSQEQINLQRAVEGIGISQANIRAGAGGDRSGKATY